MADDGFIPDAPATDGFIPDASPSSSPPMPKLEKAAAGQSTIDQIKAEHPSPLQAPAPEGAIATGARAAAGGALPMLAGLGAWGITTAAAEAIGVAGAGETFGLSLLLPLVTSTLAALATGKIQSALTPEETKLQESINAKEHPLAQVVGGLLPTVAGFEFDPGSAVGEMKGLVSLVKGAMPELERKAAMQGSQALGARAAIGVLNPILSAGLEGRLPTKEELADSVGTMMILGKPRPWAARLMGQAPGLPSTDGKPPVEPPKPPGTAPEGAGVAAPPPQIVPDAAKADTALPVEPSEKPLPTTETVVSTAVRMPDGEMDVAPLENRFQAHDEMQAGERGFIVANDQTGALRFTADRAEVAGIAKKKAQIEPDVMEAHSEDFRAMIAKRGGADTGVLPGVVPVSIGELNRAATGKPVEAAIAEIESSVHGRWEAFKNTWASMDNRNKIDALWNGAINEAKNYANREASTLHLSAKTDANLEAAYAVAAAGGDKAKLDAWEKMLVESKTALPAEKAKALGVIRTARANWDALTRTQQQAKSAFEKQFLLEHEAGLNYPHRANYVNSMWDPIPGRDEPFTITQSSGGKTGSRSYMKSKEYPTLFEGVADGQKPLTWNLADLLKSRIQSGMRRMTIQKYVENSLAGLTDPKDGMPLVVPIVKGDTPGQTRFGFEKDMVTPAEKAMKDNPGYYETIEIIPGVEGDDGIRVGVHKTYSNLIRALVGKADPNAPLQLLADAGGTIKHGFLLIDSFHAFRMAANRMTHGAGWIDSPAYKRGLALLDYKAEDLAEAVKGGEITQEMADYAADPENRKWNAIGLQAGLNTERMVENMYASGISKWPIVGTFNKFVFQKLSRGAMEEAFIVNSKRIKGVHPEWDDLQVGLYVARDMNRVFGNLMQQGWFKSEGAIRAANAAFLAPNWVNAMFEKEFGSVKEAVLDPIRFKQGVFTGSLARGMRNGLAATFIATQLLNWMTRGKFTWDNEEKDHPMDVWIPDVTGKTRGFFLSPFAIPAELTHDMIRYSMSEPNMLDAAVKIVSNKMAPIPRALYTLGTGNTPNREKIVGAWDRAKAAAIQLAPIPLGLQSFTGEANYPGQGQRQLAASFGVKLEPAKTAVSETMQRAQDYLKSIGKAPQIEITHIAGTGFGDLRNALVRQDDATAMQEIEKLRATGMDDAKIEKHFADYAKRAFTGSAAHEKDFLATLTPEQQKVYQDSLAEKQALSSRVQGLLKAHPSKSKQTATQKFRSKVKGKRGGKGRKPRKKKMTA